MTTRENPFKNVALKIAVKRNGFPFDIQFQPVNKNAVDHIKNNI